MYLYDGKDCSRDLVHEMQMWFQLFLLDYLIYIYNMLQTSCFALLQPALHVPDIHVTDMCRGIRYKTQFKFEYGMAAILII